MNSPRLAALGALVLVACASATPEPSPVASHPSATPHPQAPSVDASCTVISNVRLFDGERVTEKTSVLFRDGRIAEISPKPIARCGNTVDGAGKTLLPGLIDAHTHAHSEADLASALRYGVTTELDMFGSPPLKAKLRAYAREHADVADFFSAGAGVTSPGGHGTEYGMKVRTVDGPSDAEPFVDACVKEGSDYIKIIYTPDSKRFRSISPETLQASVEAAHRHHLLAVVHIDTLRAGQDALDAGADGLVHLMWDAAATPAFVEAALARSRAHKAFVVPTLSVLSTLSGNPHGTKLAGDGTFASRLDTRNANTLRLKLPGSLPTDVNGIRESVRILSAAGVPLLAGTDAANAGTAHGASMHGELELLVAAGLSPVEALAAATATPARMFSLKDRGGIAPGLRADLLLVDGDPTHDILATRRIARVWRGGTELTAMDAPPAEPEPVVVAPKRDPGVISDFEESVGGARFGLGWKESTDSIAGGHSTATLTRKKGGAHGQWSLDVKGEVVAGASIPWGGVMLNPGDDRFAPTNLSAAKELVFAARGAHQSQGQTIRVMLFTAHGGGMPAMKTLSLTKAWTEHRIPFADFQGADGSDVTGIAFVAGPDAGKYEFQLDDVALR